jgi:hypothetical protein
MSPLLQKFFAMGEEDCREGHGPFHPLYDKWCISEQQAYEDGRFAAVAKWYKQRRKSK